MKAKLNISKQEPLWVTAEELPVGRIAVGTGFSLLKLSPEWVLGFTANGPVELLTAVGMNVRRELQPEGTSITITT